MKPQLLDLREERCPRALLLAKRHLVSLRANEIATIYVIEMGSIKDIERYLINNDYSYQTIERDGYWRIEDIKRDFTG
ncbi:sulfurtransferase TusA family protein [Vibrio marisflavi]|uniref:UPF0033 domain-containing protein n=1 Tax=Vibrio marisflavi CECT 7928 TaxID=634439 RepID=A0ABM9A3D5_9VIBR|nr:sulfurtransferase TusA family protein [Vibrio marisflavi]CAH0539094.1 hypothetical protein VMF7928_01892 [Vibrio marisflavi CECT 7928]